MPELPEVETVVRELRPLIVGRTISRIQVSQHPLRRPWSPSWNSQLLKRRIAVLSRRGKWIFMELTQGRILVIHLGMTGQLTVMPAAQPVQPHTHVVFALGNTRQELRFRDVRRFGSVVLLNPTGDITSYVDEVGLGPEPFDVNASYWRGQLAGTRRCLKAILLDQRVVAGVGNIYADESCFTARLHPARLGNEISPAEIRRLAAAVPKVLNRAIEKRGSTIRDYVGGAGMRGEYQDEFRVYGRTALPCVNCGTAIRRTRLAGRSTHYCPRCQKA